ncbi:MAG TPA: cob(I)yrinic acid a,c-diamide adenosyltransferase [Bacteroidales bacterium]|nr:cob(I)yrinic acid a,c-diamide adenosyltransferase [Bacteroidales bacterium]
MKIYTRTGDDGTTSVSGGRRIPKQHAKIEAYGTVDELISWIGLLRCSAAAVERKEILEYVQGELMSCAAALAHDPSKRQSRLILPEDACLTFLEKEIDRMEEKLPPLNSFILPGGDIFSSYCHITRCVCRRAERAVLRLHENEETPEIVRKFLNRLSDYLFVLARFSCYESGNEEIKWTI